MSRKPSTLPDLPLPSGAVRRFGHGQLRAPFGAEHVAVSPGGDRVISASGPRCLVWHLAGGAPTPWTADAPFRAVGFAEGGRRYLLLDSTELTIVDATSGEPTGLPLGATVLAGAITADGARVVGACDDDRVRTWDAAGALVSERRVPTKKVRRLAVDRTGRRCALLEETRVRVVDLTPTGAAAVAALDAEHPHDAALSPDGARLALALPDEGLELRDAATGALVAQHATEGWCGAVALDDDHLVHATLLAGGDVALRTAAGELRWAIALPSSARRLVLAAGRVWAFTGTAVVALDLATGAELPLAPGPLGHVPRVDPAGERLLVQGDERGLLLFGRDGALERRLTAEHFMGAAASPDGARVALLGQQRLAVVRAADGVEEVARALAGCNASVAWSPDGARLAVGDYMGAVRTLDARTLEEQAALEACAGVVERLAFTPDGRLLITGQAYQAPRLWDARTGARAGKLAWTKADVWGWALAGDDRLVTSHGTTLRVWSLPAGRLVRQLPVGTGERRAKGFAVSPDGRRAAWASWHEQALHVVELDPSEGSPAAVTLEGHPGAGCEALAFTADGRRLVSGAIDGTVLEWDLAAATPAPPAPAPASASAPAPAPAPRPRTRARARRPRAPKAAEVERPASAALDLLLGGARPRGSRLALRKAGALALPDGRLVVADPHLAGEAAPLELPPGRHAVTVCVQTYGSGEDRGEEPVGVLVRFAPGRPVEWRAPFGARRGRALGPAVDSATLLLCGAARALALHEDGDELEALFPSLKAQREALGRRGWALVGPRGSNALVVSTGGDGGFPAYLGRSRAGRPLALAVPLPR